MNSSKTDTENCTINISINFKTTLECFPQKNVQIKLQSDEWQLAGVVRLTQTQPGRQARSGRKQPWLTVQS